MTKGDNKKLTIFKRKVLGKMFDPIYNLDRGTFSNIVLIVGKNNYIRRAEEDILKKVTTATIQKKHPLDRPETRWKDAVEKDIRVENVNCIC